MLIGQQDTEVVERLVGAGEIAEIQSPALPVTE